MQDNQNRAKEPQDSQDLSSGNPGNGTQGESVECVESVLTPPMDELAADKPSMDEIDGTDKNELKQPQDIAKDDTSSVEKQADAVHVDSVGTAADTDNVGPETGPEAEQDPSSDLDPLEKALADNEAIRAQMLRLAADFDNFRKRSRREIEDAYQRSKMDLLRELLPVFDNLERAVMHADTATQLQAIADGVKMVLQQFIDTIAKVGVERIDAQGKPFDPTIHEAIQQVASADHEPGTVVADLLTGYRFGDRLVRASMVVVSKAPESVQEKELQDTQSGSEHGEPQEQQEEQTDRANESPSSSKSAQEQGTSDTADSDSTADI